MAPGPSGDNEGKWNLSDEKVLMGRSAGPEEVRAWRTCSLPSKHRRAIWGQVELALELEADWTPGGRCYWKAALHSLGQSFPNRPRGPGLWLFQVVIKAGRTHLSQRPWKVLLLRGAGGPSCHLAPGFLDAGLSPVDGAGASPIAQSLPTSCSPI